MRFKEKRDKSLQGILDELSSNDPTRVRLELVGRSDVSLPVLVESLLCGSSNNNNNITTTPNTFLQHLSLQACCLGDQGVQHLCQALPHLSSSLTYLDLGGNGITDQGAMALAQALTGHASLQELVLCWNQIANRGGVALFRAMTTMDDLQVFKMSGVLEGRGGGSGDASLQTHQLLGDFNLQTAACLELAQALPHCSSLVRLCLNRQASIGSQGIAALAAALPHSALQELELQRIPVDDSAACALAATLNQSQLTFLDLTINRITNVGALALGKSLGCNTCLRDIRLTQNLIGLPGLQALERAASVNVHLERLDLYGHEAPKTGSSVVWKIKPWLRLTRRTRRIVEEAQEHYIVPEMLQRVSKASNPSRVYQILRQLPEIIPATR